MMPRGKKTDPNIISKIVAALKVFPKRLNYDKIAQECGSSKDTVRDPHEHGFGVTDS